MTKTSFIEAARREQIIGAAIEVIAEYGYADTSLARIAQATGVSNAAILYYFGSKKAVIEGAYTQVIDALTNAVHAAMISAPTARDSIEAYIRSLVGYMAEHPSHVRLIVETVLSPDLDAEPSAVRPRWAPLADAITRAQTEGQIRAVDARTSAIILGGAIDAIVAEALTDPGYALDAATDQLVTFVQRATDA